jgi:hypothetical protein
MELYCSIRGRTNGRESSALSFQLLGSLRDREELEVFQVKCPGRVDGQQHPRHAEPFVVVLRESSAYPAVSVEELDRRTYFSKELFQFRNPTDFLIRGSRIRRHLEKVDSVSPSRGIGGALSQITLEIFSIRNVCLRPVRPSQFNKSRPSASHIEGATRQKATVPGSI